MKITIITPSYAPDAELCADLNASIMKFTPADFEHLIIVPKQDLGLFSRLSGNRTSIRPAGEFLPKSFLKIPKANMWVNVRRLFPPVRGWVAQQIIKLAATASSDADMVLLMDSDMAFIRPIDEGAYSANGIINFYRLADGIHSGMPRHVAWHVNARKLLGLIPEVEVPAPQYICWPCAWSPRIVRDMLQHVERVARIPWSTAVGGLLHFSEMILYGVYVEQVLGLRAAGDIVEDMGSINHSEEVSLDGSDLSSLLASARPVDVTVMVSAKSGTSLAVRRMALAEFAEQQVRLNE